MTAFMRQQVAGTEAFQKAMTLFLAALIVHDLASAIPYMGYITVPIGYGIALWSFRELCLALAAADAKQRGGADEF